MKRLSSIAVGRFLLQYCRGWKQSTIMNAYENDLGCVANVVAGGHQVGNAYFYSAKSYSSAAVRVIP